jgi:cyanate lyase
MLALARVATRRRKFLPYKYYGASGNVPTYGYREE